MLKNKLNKIHANVMQKKKVSLCSKYNSLFQIQKLLHPTMKDHFLKANKVESNLLFKDMNNLNGSFLDICDSLCAYKPEFGVLL